MPLIPGLIFLLSGTIFFSGSVIYDQHKQLVDCEKNKKVVTEQVSEQKQSKKFIINI